jgi:hypothetical protein
MKTIIEMAREAGIRDCTCDGTRGCLERFAELVRADERGKSLELWMLLDDIDTADDIAKTDNDIYRMLCHNAQRKRWSVLNESEVDAAIRATGNT